MSCFDSVTTTTTSSMPPVNLSAVLESLVALQPLLAQQQQQQQHQQQQQLSLASAPTPLEVLVPQLSLPTLTTPLATLSLSSPVMNAETFFQSSISPLSLPPQLSAVSIASSSHPSYSTLPGALSPLIAPAIGSGLTAFSPVQPTCQLSPIPGPSSAFPRRQSAPETLLSPPGLPERRRYSDFTVHSLLKKNAALSACEQRKTSTGRKQRTIYGAHQTEVLEEVFSGQNYMVGPEREMLAQRLGLSESQVRVWFQNRRSKKRKRLQMEQSARQQTSEAPQDLDQP